MWCSPDLLQSKEGYSYDVLAHNEFFELHHCKKVSTTIDLFKDIVMLIPNKIIPHKENEHHQNTFHIVLKGERQYVVAVGSSKEEIEIKWKWIEDEIIPTIKQYKSNNIKDAQALLDFLLVKFDSMTKIQDKETIEQRSEEFNKLFNLKNEILVSNYPCNLYKIGKGELYLSENYICFISNESKENQEKVIIPFREISIIKKRSWLQNPAISISTKKKNEYYWSGFHHNVRDEAFGVIEQLWHQTLTKILKSVDVISNFHSNPSSHSAKQEPAFDIQSLEKTQASMRYNRLLRLPLCEKHIFEVAARTWEGRSEKSGQLFISNYFISFQTKTGKPYRVSVPFREIFNIAKEDKMIGGNSKAIKVIGRNRRYIFLFDSVSDRNNAYDNSIDRWNKAVLECDFLSFLPVSTSPPQVGMGELQEDRREFTSTYIEKQAKVEPFWMNYCIKHGRGCGMVEDMEFLQHLLRQGGIPDKERSWLWPLFSGATNKAHSAPTLGYYQSLLFSHSGEISKAMDEIEKDLLRSFPEHPHFLTEQGITSLRNVLTAYSRRNPTLGYCQSMNIIAAFLLCYLEEEVAFWTLAAICEDLAPENYDKNMIGSIVDVQAFEDLLARFLPQISTQMKAFNIPVTVITQGWFLCLFVGYLPLEATLRTLDNFFFSRGKMLFATALAIFKCCEQRILSAKEPDELMVLLKDLHDVMKDEEMMSLLLKTAYDFVETLDSDRLLELKGFQKFKAVKEVEKSTRNNTIRAVLERGTKFELHELHRLYEYYYSEASSTDFLINLDQFSNIIIKILPWMRWRIDLIPPFFRTLDGDHDGVVDIFAFIEGIYTVVSNGNLREKLRFYFLLHDTDNDGLLDKGDYYKVLDAIARGTKRSFFDEHVRETDLNCLVNWTFEQADKDHDQRISFDGVSNLLLSAEEDGEENNVNSNDDQLGLLEHFLKL